MYTSFTNALVSDPVIENETALPLPGTDTVAGKVTAPVAVGVGGVVCGLGGGGLPVNRPTLKDAGSVFGLISAIVPWIVFPSITFWLLRILIATTGITTVSCVVPDPLTPLLLPPLSFQLYVAVTTTVYVSGVVEGLAQTSRFCPVEGSIDAEGNVSFGFPCTTT
jgi:hypothetical protein